MSTRSQESLDSLGKALERLGEALRSTQDVSRLSIDATIQRFEFSFELLWKTLKFFLSDRGIEVNSPRACLEEAYSQKWINDEQLWLRMMKSRNLTSHTYNEDTANEIYADIHLYYEPM